METEILLHKIEFWWRNGEKRNLNGCDIDHIREEIEKGYSSGELCQEILYPENDRTDIYGWWKIAK